jgi:hypothetical protein
VGVNMLNLCATCTHEFATCKGKQTFAVDRDPDLAYTAAADAVVECDKYKVDLEKAYETLAADENPVIRELAKALRGDTTPKKPLVVTEIDHEKKTVTLEGSESDFDLRGMF